MRDDERGGKRTECYEEQAEETSESMHRATEHIRRLWAKLNKDREQGAEDEESKSENPASTESDSHG